MKAFTALSLVCVIFCVLIIVSPALASEKPSVGVKKGDWMEYNVSITGPASASSHNITRFRLEILNVEGAAFQANITAWYVNGSVPSAVWKFNFTEGNVEGWVIIPSNLGVGDTFFDSGKPGNVTIEGIEQKTVAGVTRIITHASDSKRPVKEWDMATGVYTYSVEHPKNLTIISTAVATNIWSPQILGINPPVFYDLVAVIITLTVLILGSATVVAKRKTMRKLALPHLSQGKTAVFVIFMVVLAEIGFITLFPYSTVGLSFSQINLIMQTIWTALVLISLWFRSKGNYFVHELTMLIVICVWIVGFSSVMLMDPFSGNSQVLASTPLRLVMNGLHAIFSIPALVFGVWLVVLWRPGSIIFAAKSRRIAQLVPFFWIPSYVVGVLDFLLLHTTFLT
jgi:hypothetical protein